MRLVNADIRIFNFKFSLASLLWFLLPCVGALVKISLGYGSIGDFLVYRKVFWHTIHQVNLYKNYPFENLGSYLYGPLFSVLIAPFELVSINVGAFLWAVFNAALLFFAIRKLPFSLKNQNAILLICVFEMLTSIQNMEVNCVVAAMMLLSFTYVKEEKDFWAAFFIAFGFLIKLYGVVGIVFILFSNHRTRFAFSLVFWLALLFCLPMLISSPSFVVQSYVDWFHALMVKDDLNRTSMMQNLSVMGMARHFITSQYLNSLVISIAALFYLFPLFRFDQLKQKGFQLTYFCLALIGVVIFSSSAESPTYIIAMAGVAIWFIIQNPKTRFNIFLLAFALLITSLSPTDLFPRYIRANLIQPYSLKALPCFVIWLVIVFQLLTKKSFGASDSTDYPEHTNAQISK